jgi:hypothetical protein
LEPQTPPEGRPLTESGEAAAAPGAPAPPESAGVDDLDEIKQAVDDAASVGGGLWLSYLFVLFYLAVAAGAVTHEDLFFERAVKLPFLNIELPLLAFFFLAPILFIIVHAYTLRRRSATIRRCTIRRARWTARRGRICNGGCRATSSSSSSPGRRTCAPARSAGSCARSPR